MVQYDLHHLTQSNTQEVLGPIQDDEALFLYSIVKGMRLNRLLEIGGLSGYSAVNFLKAMDQVQNGTLYTVDYNPCPCHGPNHRVITKNALDLTKTDVDSQPVDLVFFDCHDMVQMDIYHRFVNEGIITDRTILALHDTNLHYPPFQAWGPYISSEGGYAHQVVERRMVNMFKDLGYNVFMLHTTADKHDDTFPYRHGVTVCQKNTRLASS